MIAAQQALYAVAQGIAQKFPAAMRDRYVQAAKTVRLPYYDWAMRPPPAATSAFPDSLSSARISVVDVDGVSKQIDNPLYQFNFHPANPAPGDFDAQWSSRKTTVRYPDSSGGSRDAMVARVLTNENDSLRRNVSLVLLSYHDFDAFSNNQWRGADQSHGSFGSLEGHAQRDPRQDRRRRPHGRPRGGGFRPAVLAAPLVCIPLSLPYMYQRTDRPGWTLLTGSRPSQQRRPSLGHLAGPQSHRLHLAAPGPDLDLFHSVRYRRVAGHAADALLGPQRHQVLDRRPGQEPLRLRLRLPGNAAVEVQLDPGLLSCPETERVEPVRRQRLPGLC